MLGILSEQEITALLKRCMLGRIGCTDGERVYVVPVNFVFNGKYLIAHSREGLKIDMMRKNPRVCFEVEDIRDMNNWESVVLQGVFEELVDEADKYEAMKIMVDRVLKLKISDTAIPPHLSGNRVHLHQPGNIRAVVYRVAITEMSGRYERN